jgi:hypothetical protein
MGKVVGASPALTNNSIKGGFKADINGMLQVIPGGLTRPNYIAKKFVR